MSDFFYLSDKPDESGEYIVHSMNCENLPSVVERTQIGFEKNSEDALKVARELFSDKKVVFCPICYRAKRKGNYKEVK